ncbi:MAG: NTP transferase domain-containing protein, partial [Gammaproteobacteria bacterium]|nr:NTP transferase domain-containing protein [Gammaproteobacteria bacterium]
MNCWGILPAAGSGSRFGAEVPKQYLPVNGRPVISWSIETLLAAP